MTKSIQERLDIVNNTFKFGMLMTKPLKAGTLKNRTIGDSCTGYTFQIDNLSYRGIWVSTIEDIQLVVDGETVSKRDMLFCIKGMKIPIDDLGGHSEVFWGGRDEGLLSVNKVGGLAPGEHTVEIEIIKRQDFGHSYGEGAEGYEDAKEFLNPSVIKDKIVYTVS